MRIVTSIDAVILTATAKPDASTADDAAAAADTAPPPPPPGPAVCDDTNLHNNPPQGPCNVLGVTMPGGLPNPERSADNVARPETGLIVKFNPANSRWEDEISRDWSPLVAFS